VTLPCITSLVGSLNGGRVAEPQEVNLGCLHPVARVTSYDVGMMMVVRPKHVAMYSYTRI
jgi:hypothetical protein